MRDEDWMQLALEQAGMAASHNDVPVGAVVVKGQELIAAAHNERELTNDPTAHAEMLALRRAAKQTGTWRLTGATVYVTLEPCPMCAGAMVAARLRRVVYGAPDERAGAAWSLYNIPQDARLNHRCELTAGVLAEDSAQLLQDFFKVKRRKPQTL